MVRKLDPDILKKGHEYEDTKERTVILLAARREIEKQLKTKHRFLETYAPEDRLGYMQEDIDGLIEAVQRLKSTNPVHAAATGGITKNRRIKDNDPGGVPCVGKGLATDPHLQWCGEKSDCLKCNPVVNH